MVTNSKFLFEVLQSEFLQLSESLGAANHIEQNSLISLAQKIQQLAQKKSQDPNKDLIKEIFSYLDITSLNSCDTADSVRDICSALISDQTLKPAAVCFFPSFCTSAKEALSKSSIKLAVVEDSFPHGNSPLPSRTYGVNACIQTGADEIDMVISRGAANAGNLAYICEEVSALKQVCGQKTLKVILNTAELIPAASMNLNRASFIYKLSLACLESGADFLKTSTGKEGSNADLADSIAICLALKNFNSSEKDLNPRGFNAAGGIKTIQDAITYRLLAQLTFKDLSSSVFRIGASSLAKVLEGTLHGATRTTTETSSY